VRVVLILVVLIRLGAQPVRAQVWALPLVNPQGDTMYTQLDAITQVAPNVYRAWSKYVYATPQNGDAGALVQKDYDCDDGMRRVVFAVFYDINRRKTSRSDHPGQWIPVTRTKGHEQWAAVCARARWGVLADLVLTLQNLFS
jgi:hypothetical protein